MTPQLRKNPPSLILARRPRRVRPLTGLSRWPLTLASQHSRTTAQVHTAMPNPAFTSDFGSGVRVADTTTKYYNRSRRRFNTEGPVRPDKHYAIQPLDRANADELLDLIRAERYFVLHAPRQTGKTSALIALRDLLNSGEAGNFRCVDVNVEVGQVARDDTARGIRAKAVGALPRFASELSRRLAL